MYTLSVMAKRKPSWATPPEETKSNTTVVSIRIAATALERVDRLAGKTDQSRGSLLRRIIEDAATGPDSQQVLGE